MNSTCKLASAGIMTVGLTAFGLLGATAANASGVQPVGADDYYTINQGETLTVAAPGILANDVDPEGDPMHVGNSFAFIAADSVTVNADGSFTFTPPANFYGTAGFSYYSSDDTNYGSQVNVHITVNPTAAPVPLVAQDDVYATPAGTPLVVPAASGLLANDSGPGVVWVVNSPGIPSGALIVNQDGSFTYTPGAGVSGTVTFGYRTSDGNVESNDAEVTITVGTPPVVVPPAAAPVVADDHYVMDKNTTLTVPAASGLLANDSGAVSVYNTVGAGQTQVQGDGSLVFTPTAGFVGTVTFQYRATVDGQQFSNYGTVTIDVNDVVVPPVTPGGGLVPTPPAIPTSSTVPSTADLPTLAYTGGADDVSTWLAAPAAVLIGLGGLGLWYSRRRAQNS